MTSAFPSWTISNFYPRPPRGGRQGDVVEWPDFTEISIHALREEGDCNLHLRQRNGRHISIHALREEGDSTTALFIFRR